MFWKSFQVFIDIFFDLTPNPNNCCIPRNYFNVESTFLFILYFSNPYKYLLADHVLRWILCLTLNIQILLKYCLPPLPNIHTFIVASFIVWYHFKSTSKKEAQNYPLWGSLNFVIRNTQSNVFLKWKAHFVLFFQRKYRNNYCHHNMHSLLLTLQMKNGMATVPTLSSVMLYEVEMLQVHIAFYHENCLRDFKIGKFNKIYNFMASLRLLLIKILPFLLSKYHLAFAKKRKKKLSTWILCHLHKPTQWKG